MGKQPPSPEEQNREWSRMTGIGIEFIVAVAVCGALGYWLDRKLGLSPWMLILGIGLGFGVGLSLLVRAARKSFHD
jgi:F0F1-type ATP synthase assembly protein I